MAEFFAAFPKGDQNEPSPVLLEAARYVESSQLGSNPLLENALGGAVAITTSPAHAPRLFMAPDGYGWIVVKGIMFDIGADGPRVDLETVWNRFSTNRRIDWNRFEGFFALAVWDGRGRRGFALNDQTSTLNAYYAEDERYVYFATRALPLARVLGRGIDPASAREFLARGALVAPSTMFTGLKRLDVGEHVVFEDHAASVGRHWHFPDRIESWSLRRSAEEAAGVSSDRVRRYALAAGGKAVFDLTSGYDSRLLASAAHHAGIEPSVTVNGPGDDEEVVIASRVAQAAGWPMFHFDPFDSWTRTVDAETRRQLAIRTDGNLPFTEIYHHLVTRPVLAAEFRLHAAGVGGEFIRYHPWGQEFFRIGRRGRANVDNILKFRMLHGGAPPPVFASDWYGLFKKQLRSRVEAVCALLPGTLITQQLDAVHVWKQTGHPSLYLSATFDWLPTTVPSMSAGFVTVGMVTPWRHRLTAGLTRRVIHTLCPEAASVVTRYGGTAGPVRPSNLIRHLYQPLKRFGHLAAKLDRVFLRGVVTGRLRPRVPWPPVPYAADEFRSFLNPDSMYTRELFCDAGFAWLRSWTGASEKLLLRVATLEQVCRELDFKPDAGFLGHP